jgi:hypothetical protein
MPVELIVFTADRRIRGSIPLADDRLSDMLNSVPRIVIRGAELQDLASGNQHLADVTVTVGSIVAVLASGRRGIETRRRRTELHKAKLGLVRYIVSGWLHVPPGSPANLSSREPQVVLAGRDILVPLTEASISYDKAGENVTEAFETILINRSQATWIDLDDAAGGDDGDTVDERPKVYHAAMAKDFTGAT